MLLLLLPLSQISTMTSPKSNTSSQTQTTLVSRLMKMERRCGNHNAAAGSLTLTSSVPTFWMSGRTSFAMPSPTAPIPIPSACSLKVSVILAMSPPPPLFALPTPSLSSLSMSSLPIPKGEQVYYVFFRNIIDCFCAYHITNLFSYFFLNHIKNKIKKTCFLCHLVGGFCSHFFFFICVDDGCNYFVMVHLIAKSKFYFFLFSAIQTQP